jgi:DNA-binding response OmpR family regulator
MARALIVEDDAHIRDLISLHLGLEGLDASAVPDGREALRLVATQPFDLVILDIMLPGVDGIAVCRALRRGGPNQDVPVLMLTARREESDKVLGLESGADDYLAKPFGIRELIARVRALLRRPRASRLTAAAAENGMPADRPISLHGIDVDPSRRRARVRGVDVDLTAQEFRLLHLLASYPGIVFSREALLSRVWPDHTHVTPRSVDTLVKRLRRRVEERPGEPRLVLTVWGSGYKFADV